MEQFSQDMWGGYIQTQPNRIARDFPGRNYWTHEPGVDRVVDGIPDRVDRIKCLGNAVVPQQFYPIFRAIYLIETIPTEEHLQGDET